LLHRSGVEDHESDNTANNKITGFLMNKRSAGLKKQVYLRLITTPVVVDLMLFVLP
jgi:hypothetical protein